MKILLVNKFLYMNGGSETYTFKLGKYLESQGHDVQYFGMDNPRRCVGNKFEIYTSPMDFHNGSKLSKITYPIKTVYNNEAAKKIKIILDKFNPDVVHINNFNYQLTPSIILSIVKWKNENNCNCKILYTAHDYQLVCPNHSLYNPNSERICEQCLGGHFKNCLKNKCIHGSTARSAIGMIEAKYWNKKNVYQYFDYIICPSNFIKSRIDTNTALKSKTVVIHNFVEVGKRTEKIENKKYILYYGRIVKEKGAEIIIKAARKLPNIRFIIAGKGPMLENMKNFNNIDCVGFKTGDELWNLISNARFTVCPSQCYESFGLTIGESILLGTPVIGSDIGAIPELIVNDFNGLIYKSDDSNDFIKKISALWSDDKLLKRLEKGCMETKWLSIANYTKELMKYYV